MLVSQSTIHIPSFILEVKSITQRAGGSHRLPKEKLTLNVTLNIKRSKLELIPEKNTN
jgi:hypothetical protein